MSCRDAKFNILFTMHNAVDRERMTNDILDYYTNTLEFPVEQLFFVDSSARGVKDTRIPDSNQVVFDQKLGCPNISNSTDLESCSIRKISHDDAIMHRLLQKDYTVKLTAKYKLPDICSAVHEGMETGSTVLIQSNHLQNWQNTELWGAKSDQIYDIIENVNLRTGLMEHRFFDQCQKTDCHRLKPLENVADYKRGAGDLLSQL